MSKQKPEEREAPNPKGKSGNPISLAPLTFDEAVRKILASPPEPKPTKTSSKKPATRKTK